MPFGLVSSEQTDDFWAINTRRRVLHDYPNGTAPMMALCSMSETEFTPYPEFKWTEERYQMIKTVTASGPTSGVFLYLGGSTTTAGGPTTVTSGMALRVYVADASNFQEDDTIIIDKLTLTSGVSNLTGVVTSANSTSNYIEFRATNVPASTIINTGSPNANIGGFVILSGSAYNEGARSRNGRYLFPYDVENYTQIFKTPFEMTRTALKEPQKYDKSGAYRELFKKNAITHLQGLELSAFFGNKYKTTSIDPDTGAVTPKRTTGGLQYFLNLYETGGVTYGGSTLSDIRASNWRSEPGKRIIELGGATITGADFDDLNTRAFDRTYTSDWSKLVLCGSGYLSKMESYFKGQTTVSSMRDEGFDGFDFRMTHHQSNAGSVYYKVHPLFNDPSLPFMRNSAFYVDLAAIKWRPLSDTDTEIQPMIQLPDADKRKDQFLTEGGWEVPFPDAHMFIRDLGGITK